MGIGTVDLSVPAAFEVGWLPLWEQAIVSVGALLLGLTIVTERAVATRIFLFSGNNLAGMALAGVDK